MYTERKLSAPKSGTNRLFSSLAVRMVSLIFANSIVSPSIRDAFFEPAFLVAVVFSLSDRAEPRRDRLGDNDRVYMPRGFSGASRRRGRWRSFGRRNQGRCWEDSRHPFWRLQDSRLLQRNGRGQP